MTRRLRLRPAGAGAPPSLRPLDAAPDDPDAVLDAMRPRLRRAQRNHRIATSAVATLVLVGALVVGFAAFRGSDTGSVRITPPAGSSPSVPTTTAAPPDPGDADGLDPRRGRQLGRPTATARRPVGRSPSPPVPAHPRAGPRLRRRHPRPEPTTVPTTSDTPRSRRPAVRSWSPVDGSSISLGSSTPAAGFGAEVHDNGPTRVEVRFTNGRTEWRIRVELGAATSRRRSPSTGDRGDRCRLQPSVRGASSADGSSRYATTCQRPLRRAISTRLCTTVLVVELDRGDGHRRVAAVRHLVDATRSTRPPSVVLLRVRRPLGGDEPAPVEAVAQLRRPRACRATRSRGDPTPARTRPRPRRGPVRGPWRSRRPPRCASARTTIPTTTVIT